MTGTMKSIQGKETSEANIKWIGWKNDEELEGGSLLISEIGKARPPN